jgi:undecaprenyl-diphosphatase
MTLLQAIVLGVVQGGTEFLPISSSAHLVLVPWALGWQIDEAFTFPFDVLVQWGTLLAVMTYFRADLWAIVKGALIALGRGRPLSNPEARLAWLLLLSSLPAAALGLLAKPLVEASLLRPWVVSLFLLGTALLLLLGERLGRLASRIEDVGWRDALWIGLAQALSLFPGISRSGATIAGGLIRDLRRADAARFSFLMAVPVMIGAGLIALMDLFSQPALMAQLGALLAGFLAATFVGYLAIAWLLSYLRRGSLRGFAIYCAAVGVLGLILSVLRA